MRETKPTSFSPAAIVGVLVIVVGVVALGIWGPRMHQRMLPPLGNGLSDLIKAAIDDYASVANQTLLHAVETTLNAEKAQQVLETTLGSSGAIPDFTSFGYELVDASPSDLLAGSSGRGVKLVFQRQESMPQPPLVMYLFDSEVKWLHFDPLGRQVELRKSVRLDDWIEFAPGGFIAVSVLHMGDTMALLMGLDPNLVEDAADVLGSPETEKPEVGFESVVFSTSKSSICRLRGAIIEKTPFPRCCA